MGSDFPRPVGPCGARFQMRRRGFAPQVVDGYFVFPRLQIEGHGRAHCSQTYESSTHDDCLLGDCLRITCTAAVAAR
jgi:hypothetical protein